jgi:glucose-6-phosphate isomerase
MQGQQLWERFKQYRIENSALGISLDVSRVNFPDDYFSKLGDKREHAKAVMQATEQGERVNKDEDRMVGHYWLRNPKLAPDATIAAEISGAIDAIESFSKQVHEGKVVSPKGERFDSVILIGIGGSALGPQLLASCFRGQEKMNLFVLDNTDPDGIEATLHQVPSLEKALVLVVSKSGGTKETYNGMVLVQSCYESKGLNFAKHAIAVTMQDSKLDKHAVGNGWLKRFPIWDWVGGRTSFWSPVGLVPGMLLGLPMREILTGAAEADEWCRNAALDKDPALQLATVWHYLTNGKGDKAMVVLPYKDRLELFGKYLQQLVMESLGKQEDLDGKTVYQGIAVYGNKGSTDQHSYIQQLREGPNQFYAVFIEVLQDAAISNGSWKSNAVEVAEGIVAGDYLQGFYLGTREALYQNGRESISLTVETIDGRRLGALVALFERAVGYYATLVNINAYHQPGVEAGKKAAELVIDLQVRTMGIVQEQKAGLSLTDLVAKLGEPNRIEDVYRVLQHQHANGRVKKQAGGSLESDIYSF